MKLPEQEQRTQLLVRARSSPPNSDALLNLLCDASVDHQQGRQALRQLERSIILSTLVSLASVP
jgi:hypothetical protein